MNSSSPYLHAPRRPGIVPAPGVPGAGAFTLIEVLLALAICAVVLVAIHSVFIGAIRLRDKTTEAAEEPLLMAQATETIRRDLKNVAGPRGYMAGDFKCDAQSMGQSLGVSGNGSGLDFFTTTGAISQGANWGDIQEVIYQLSPPKDRNQLGMDLIRYANRNLLSQGGAVSQTPEAEVLVGGLEAVEFECYDGSEWRNWDTSLTDTNLPVAVRLTFHQAVARGDSGPKPDPIELIVPLSTLTLTNVAQSANSSGFTGGNSR